MAELCHFFCVEHVLQTFQRHLMVIFFKAGQHLVAHALGGRVGRDLLGMGGLQLFQTAVKHVIFIIAHGSCIQNVVEIAVLV